MSEPLPLLTDAELDSRRGGFFKDHFAEGAPVTDDTLKRAEAAIERLEKRAKERPASPSLAENPKPPQETK